MAGWNEGESEELSDGLTTAACVASGTFDSATVGKAAFSSASGPGVVVGNELGIVLVKAKSQGAKNNPFKSI